MSALLPPDVAAYLAQAAVALAIEQNFHPVDPEETSCWMEQNHKEIGQRALDAMHELQNTLLGNPEIMEEVSNHICKAVYEKIPKPTTRQYIQKFLDYCKERGCEDPEKMKEMDGGSMAPYMAWSHFHNKDQ